ncbi:unnamed protein product [Adineta steineri]|uniref:Uncharacterized protein n=1 Tax=Adineta steineri TaxID=433720 RepID=A0A818HI73_9BILA|nr:unnamed protein product [Adineta steineri]CAF3506715.1 unnamed protein product [Adineta steineri]
MNEISSISTIDQKMAEMRIKNLELLKRHQEIEEDRQLAVQTGAITTTTTANIVEPIKDKKAMRSATKNRTRIPTNQLNTQENQSERLQRPPIRRKFEIVRNDTQQPQRAQRIDYNRLKREHAQEINNPKPNNNNSINPNLHQYAYPFHKQSINNNNADKIGSGRFNQQQRAQEQGQRKREERMRRCTVQNSGHPGGGTNEFHLDVPPMPIWQNNQMHVQLLPTNINNHHTGIDHLINTSGDQLDQSAYIHNFVYPPPAQASPFNGNGTVYFAHPAPPPSSSSQQPPPSQTHFHQYHSARTFENNNRHQFQIPSFQTSPIFQPQQQPPPAVLSTSNNYQQQETSPTDVTPRFRHIKTPEHENRPSQTRPMSGDFERLHNSHHLSSTRFNNNNNNHRFQARPQSFYDFSSNNNNNNQNNFFHSSNNNRFQRNNNNNNINNNNTSLPLSAYMNTDESLNENENMNNNNTHWGTSSYQRRRSIQNQQQQQHQHQQQQQRTYHQDKHQFPLSSYDPRQYGFDNNYQRKNNFNNGINTNRRNLNNNRNTNDMNNSNDIDLIEEWWEDNNTELIGTNQSITNTDMQTKSTTVIDDSGNSSLSTSMNLKESISDDFNNPLSDVSTTDSNIIESLDKLQQELKLEEAVDERLATTNHDNLETINSTSNKEPTTYDTAHFMQWAKEKFREELAGRLTAQEIQQHDAATTDDDDDDDDDNNNQSTTNIIEKMDALEDDLHEKLTIDEHQSNTNESIVVE